MASHEHDQLVRMGASWLRRKGFGVVATELTCEGAGEQPDVLGFRSRCSAIIEAKVSRSDFQKDGKKPWRSSAAALGVYRFYLCPEGLILPSELPERWGLLYACKNRVSEIVVPRGNLWPKYGETSQSDFLAFQHRNCELKERSALYSIARRMQR